jgi:hypothetical protein
MIRTQITDHHQILVHFNLLMEKSFDPSFGWSLKENKIASIKWQPRPSPEDELDDGHFYGYGKHDTPTYDEEGEYIEQSGSPARHRTDPKERPDASYLYLVPPTAREPLKTLQSRIEKEGIKTLGDNIDKYGFRKNDREASSDARSRLKVFLSRHNIQRRLQICHNGERYCGNIFDPSLVPEWKRCSQDGCSDRKQPCHDCVTVKACGRCHKFLCREHVGSHEIDCRGSLSQKCGSKNGSDTLEIQCCGRVLVETENVGKQCRECSTVCCEDCLVECLGPPSSSKGKRWQCGKGWCSSCAGENYEEEEQCCYACLELASRKIRTMELAMTTLRVSRTTILAQVTPVKIPARMSEVVGRRRIGKQVSSKNNVL